jgi:hypothetical protein
MNPISRRQANERVALERVALFARTQLIQAIDEMLANFIGPEALNKARDSNAARSSKRFDSEHKRFCNIAEALRLWHSNDDFLTTDGSPRPLPRTGRLSLATLTRLIVGSAAKSKDLVTDLLQFGLVEELDGVYHPARRSAVLGKANALNLAYATITATRLLKTISHNVTTGSPPLYERQVSEVTIRTVDLPMYLRFIDQQAQYLIDSADDWLSRRRVAPVTRGDGIKVGIGAFAWADFSSNPASKRLPRAGRGNGLRK